MSCKDGSYCRPSPNPSGMSLIWRNGPEIMIRPHPGKESITHTHTKWTINNNRVKWCGHEGEGELPCEIWRGVSLIVIIREMGAP